MPEKTDPLTHTITVLRRQLSGQMGQIMAMVMINALLGRLPGLRGLCQMMETSSPATRALMAALVDVMAEQGISGAIKLVATTKPRPTIWHRVRCRFLDPIEDLAADRGDACEVLHSLFSAYLYWHLAADAGVAPFAVKPYQPELINLAAEMRIISALIVAAQEQDDAIVSATRAQEPPRSAY